MLGISFYNFSKMNDACFVAQNSLDELKKISLIERKMDDYEFGNNGSSNSNSDSNSNSSNDNGGRIVVVNINGKDARDQDHRNSANSVTSATSANSASSGTTTINSRLHKSNDNDININVKEGRQLRQNTIQSKIQQQQQQQQNSISSSKPTISSTNAETIIVQIPQSLYQQSYTSTIISSSSTTSSSSTLPKIIHQQWKNNQIPSKFQKWHSEWQKLYPSPEYQHILWTDDTARQFIQTHYPWFLSIYDNYEHNINRADAVRYFILYHYGGIYADLDYEPLVNFYNYLPTNMVGFIESPYYWNEKRQNSFMTSPIHDPFWLDLFTVLIKNSIYDDVLIKTGPSLVDDAILDSDHPTYVFPCENFHRVPLGEFSDASITTVLGREMQFRFKPISKQCGVYTDDQCHFGKHHNTVSYRNVLGKLV